MTAKVVFKRLPHGLAHDFHNELTFPPNFPISFQFSIFTLKHKVRYLCQERLEFQEVKSERLAGRVCIRGRRANARDTIK